MVFPLKSKIENSHNLLSGCYITNIKCLTKKSAIFHSTPVESYLCLVDGYTEILLVYTAAKNHLQNYGNVPKILKVHIILMCHFTLPSHLISLSVVRDREIFLLFLSCGALGTGNNQKLM